MDERKINAALKMTWEILTVFWMVMAVFGKTDPVESLLWAVLMQTFVICKNQETHHG